MSRELYLGLISGTSMDGLDCALVSFDGERPCVLDFHTEPMPPRLKKRLLALCDDAGVDQVQELGETDVALGEFSARVALAMLDNNGLTPAEITAIGSHGQTVRHSPRQSTEGQVSPFTLQIGDPNTICEKSGITTVADFRRKDLAAGGQGAPLAPAFHREVFHSDACTRVILNIGGMANITIIPREPRANPVSAFDTGPGNVLMDYWAERHLDRPFDEDGAWAAGGTCDDALLAVLLDEPYFRATPPKSTGRELFNGAWLEDRLAGFAGSVTPEDVQATLLELTAASIAGAIKPLADEGEVIVCGGGAGNSALMQRLARRLPAFRVAASTAYGLHADSVEAVAFAWLARKALAREPVDCTGITGADHPNILGGVYYREGP